MSKFDTAPSIDRAEIDHHAYLTEQTGIIPLWVWVVYIESTLLQRRGFLSSDFAAKT